MLSMLKKDVVGCALICAGEADADFWAANMRSHASDILPLLRVDVDGVCILILSRLRVQDGWSSAASMGTNVDSKTEIRCSTFSAVGSIKCILFQYLRAALSVC